MYPQANILICQLYLYVCKRYRHWREGGRRHSLPRDAQLIFPLKLPLPGAAIICQESLQKSCSRGTLALISRMTEEPQEKLVLGSLQSSVRSTQSDPPPVPHSLSSVITTPASTLGLAIKDIVKRFLASALLPAPVLLCADASLAFVNGDTLA